MIGLVAHTALQVALAATIFGLVALPIAVRSGRRDWVQLGYGAVYANFFLVTVATIAMMVVA